MNKLATLLLIVLLPLACNAQKHKVQEAAKCIKWLISQMGNRPDSVAFLEHLPTTASFESFTTYSKNKVTKEYDLPTREFFVEYFSAHGAFFVEATFEPSNAYDSTYGLYLLKSISLEVTIKPSTFKESAYLAELGYTQVSRSEEERIMNKSISRWEGREKDVNTWMKKDPQKTGFIEVGYPYDKTEGYYCDFNYYKHDNPR